MSVIGFDIGNESCVIAAAKRGGVDVLLNDESKRETPAVVSFGDKQRFLGSAGAAFATANPKSTVSQIKRLIGKLYIEVEEDLKRLPFTTREGPRGGILIELEYLKTKWLFTPVEILGMLLKHLKQTAEKSLESSVFDCVIGIPSYFSDLQRRMYLDAAHIAGLNPLRLIHDGTAIALGYGMYKTDLSNSSPTIVMFVDIGHCDTQVTVADFEQGRMTILSHSFDQNLGGRDFDEILFKYFAEKFNENHKIDVYSNARACVRLMTSCEKVKKVLSANAEAPLSIECLIGDTDVRGIITREEFENLSSKLLERVIVCCGKALKDSGLTIDKIYTVELVGSGSRIPAITRVLSSFFKKEPTRTLNASECVARGCALRCAMLSPNLKVRDYKVEDSFPYSIVIPLPQKELLVFPSGSPLPNEKMMKHIGNTSFDVQLAYITERDFPAGISPTVGRFEIGPSEDSDAEKVKVEFRIKLNDNGIVDIDCATILEDKHSSGRAVYSYLWATTMANSDTLNLPVSENLDVSTTNDELVEAEKKEKMLTEQDIKVEEIKDQRNTLESFVYDTRSKLSGAYKSFATDSVKEVITNELQETEDWLYEDSDDESESDYTGRLKHLKKLLEPIENRYNEEKAIAKATNYLQSYITKYHSHAESLPASTKEKVENVCAKTEQWLVNAASQKHLSPKAFLTDLNHAIEFLERDCKSIMRAKPSVPRYEEPMDLENAMVKAAKPLQDCIEKYYSLAESLPSYQKEKVTNVCNKAQLLLNDNFQKHSSPNSLSASINRGIEYVESNCEKIIRSQPSIPKHEEPMNSDQRGRIADSEDVKTEAIKALEACIEKHHSQAESFPADMKNEVNGVCYEAHKWLICALSEKEISPSTFNKYANHVIKQVESKCKSINGSTFQRHEHEDSDQRDQPVDSDQRDQPVDTDHVDQAVNSDQPMDTDQVDQSVGSDQREHTMAVEYISKSL